MYTYLIVDDEMIERKGIRMLLSWMNIRENILEASNGEEALEVFEKEKIDVLLTEHRSAIDGTCAWYKTVRLPHPPGGLH